MKKIWIGSGAGYSGDRVDPAVELIRHAPLNYIAFECLAERTIALAQQARAIDPQKGYDPLLEERMRRILVECQQKGIKIITNMGAANPRAAAEKTQSIALELGIHSLKIAYIEGDDVLDLLDMQKDVILETGEPLSVLEGKITAANAYLGVSPIVEALSKGADVVITGRVADPALFLAPMVYEFGWDLNDFVRLGQGTMIGHLLECAGQVTGGYYADSNYKVVPNLAQLGFPFVEVSEDGSAVIQKLEQAGGIVNTATCTEQLLYEIHDPSAYWTPDVCADFSRVTMQEIAANQVRVDNAAGRAPNDSYKVSVAYHDSFIGEGQISYAGETAYERAKLAAEIIADRLEQNQINPMEIRYDYIGINAIHEDHSYPHPFEVRLRVTARTDTWHTALKIVNEVEALYTNGPAAGGGATKFIREVVAVASILIDRNLVVPQVHLLELNN